MKEKYFIEKNSKRISYYDDIDKANKDAKRIGGTVGIEKIDNKFEKWLKKSSRFTIVNRMKKILKKFLV